MVKERKMRRSGSAQVLGLMVGAAALMVVGGSPAARAGIEPELSVTGGTGVPGGTVSVTLALADDVANAGVSAGVDLRFSAESLEFFEPVADSCAVAERIAETHGVAGRLLDVDLLNLEVFVSGSPNPLPPLGDGELVTCDFRVKDGVPAGTVALEIEAPFLGDSDGGQIPVRVRNGFVVIVTDISTPTPTATSTPPVTNTPTRSATATGTVQVTATATATNTSSTPGTPTATPPVTATATATRTGGGGTPTATNTSTTPPPATATATATRTGGGGGTPTRTAQKVGTGGCNVVPTDPTATPGAAALLLLPALLLWVRRREH
jgi:MYXO-CTERM domain-containing protein